MFQELATNAAKHGALLDNTGHVDISWQIEPGAGRDRLRLLWREAGGPQVNPPTHRGLGSELIEGGLAKELKGEVSLDYDPAGVVCRITMPYTHQDARGAPDDQ